MVNKAKTGFIDLKLGTVQNEGSVGLTRKGASHEFWQNRFLSTDGFHFSIRVSEMRGAISRRVQGQGIHLLESVSMHGICPADVQGKSERHRGVSSLCSNQAVSSWDSRESRPEYSGSCECGTRLAHLRGICASFDSESPKALRRGGIGSPSRSNSLCFGFNDHRFMFITFPMGQIQETESCDQNAHPVRYSRQRSNPCHYYSRQGSRREYSRRTAVRSRRYLHSGSSVSGLCTPPSDRRGFSFLRNPSKKEFPVQAAILSSGGQGFRSSMRSNHCAQRLLFSKRLSREVTTNSLFRRKQRTPACFSYQQLPLACSGYCHIVPLPLAGRIILQMDQAAFENQSFLRYNPKCREDANMDRHLYLCAGGHRKEGSQTHPEPLHNSTDFERHPVSENPHFTGAFRK